MALRFSLRTMRTMRILVTFMVFSTAYLFMVVLLLIALGPRFTMIKHRARVCSARLHLPLSLP